MSKIIHIIPYLFMSGCATHVFLAPNPSRDTTRLHSVPTPLPDDLVGTHTFEECGSLMFNGMVPCWAYVVEIAKASEHHGVISQPVTISVSGYQYPEFHIDTMGVKNGQFLDIFFKGCDSPECNYRKGDQLLTFQLKNNMIWVQFDGKMSSMTDLEEIPENKP